MALETIAYHVCEKNGSFGDVHIPDVNAVYQQILDANAGKYPNVLLLPEYNGHSDWAQELAWISANFGGQNGIPVMLDIAGGGWQYTIEQISAAMAVANVRWLRIAELTSWYIENSLPFPDDYVLGILEFCKANGLKLFWAEWKVDYGPTVETFNKIASLVAGYEDIVTVAFKTNSGDLEPAAGFQYVLQKGFSHTGAVVETWYWETRHRNDQDPASSNSEENMPISWMICHAQEAVAAGAEVIQFEPYWYFFSSSTGKANSSLSLMHQYLNSQLAGTPLNTVLLQTLQGEWLNSVAKTDVAWLDGRVTTLAGFDIQPSKFDFLNMPKKYAVCCYCLSASSPSRWAWLKYQVICVDILVKTQGTTLDKAAFVRDSMRVEVERILDMYSRVGPLWDSAVGPTGAPRRRRVPGLRDVMISQEGNPVEDTNYSRVTIQLRCWVFPKKSWVSL